MFVGDDELREIQEGIEGRNIAQQKQTSGQRVEIVVNRSRQRFVGNDDYNLDALTGRLFLLRYISTFDSFLNLTQLVVTYEHRANSLNSAVYTARARRNFK